MPKPATDLPVVAETRQISSHRMMVFFVIPGEIAENGEEYKGWFISSIMIMIIAW